MKKFTVDLNFYLKDLEGKEMPDLHAGKTLANNLSLSTEGDALKHMAWAMAFFKQEPVDLDESDLNTLTSYVKNHTKMVALVKSQILQYLEEVKITSSKLEKESKKNISKESI